MDVRLGCVYSLVRKVQRCAVEVPVVSVLEGISTSGLGHVDGFRVDIQDSRADGRPIFHPQYVRSHTAAVQHSVFHTSLPLNTQRNRFRQREVGDRGMSLSGEGEEELVVFWW